MRIFKTNLSILFLFISSVAFSQVTYDTNNDTNIDENEFKTGFANNYKAWDTNNDQVIDHREFFEYGFNSLDIDQDRNLTQTEWEKGFDDIYGDYLGERDFNRFDMDSNDRISQAEFEDSMRNSYYFSDFDTNRDRKVDFEELNKNVFSNMDRNRDGRIDRIEKDKLGYYYLERPPMNN